VVKRPRAVIVGGGFGGLYAAKTLNESAEVMLIDRKNHHTFQPLLYQVALAMLPAEIASSLRHLRVRATS
jgi:NADH dehydrogenase